MQIRSAPHPRRGIDEGHSVHRVIDPLTRTQAEQLRRGGDALLTRLDVDGQLTGVSTKAGSEEGVVSLDAGTGAVAGALA